MPAGSWHVIADAVVNDAVDVLFEMIWRRGDTDTTIASWTQHFDAPVGLGFYVPIELDVTATAIDFQAGDQFVWRYTGMNGSSDLAFEANADDDGTGRDTQLTPPPPAAATAGDER